MRGDAMTNDNQHNSSDVFLRQQQKFTTPRRCCTMSSTSTSKDRGVLLSLPQSDLAGNNNKGTLQKADLMLFQLPKDEQLQNDFYSGKCQILANQYSASLVSPSNSYKLVTVGTTNTLVVWKDGENDLHNTKVTDDEASPPPAKKAKNDHKVTACRLIQPGGSGSSFLVGQEHTVDPQKLLEWFVAYTKPSETGSGVPGPDRINTSKVANKFQCSNFELRRALSHIPNVVAYDSSEVWILNDYPSLSPPNDEWWQLVSDEEVLCGQRALVEYAIEEDSIFTEEEGVAVMDEVAKGVSQKLMPLLVEYDATTKDAGSTARNKNVKERSLAIAKKTVFMAQTEQAKKKIDSRSVRLDPNVIAFYVLRDLFLEFPNYAMSDLLDKWTGRLPMGEVFEKCVTLEWLQEEGFVPQQLVTEEVDDNAATATNNAYGKVIRLAVPNTVLSWSQTKPKVGTPSKGTPKKK